jgi:hypothetical protein
MGAHDRCSEPCLNELELRRHSPSNHFFAIRNYRFTRAIDVRALLGAAQRARERTTIWSHAAKPA